MYDNNNDDNNTSTRSAVCDIILCTRITDRFDKYSRVLRHRIILWSALLRVALPDEIIHSPDFNVNITRRILLLLWRSEVPCVLTIRIIIIIIISIMRYARDHGINHVYRTTIWSKAKSMAIQRTNGPINQDAEKRNISPNVIVNNNIVCARVRSRNSHGRSSIARLDINQNAWQFFTLWHNEFGIEIIVNFKPSGVDEDRSAVR